MSQKNHSKPHIMLAWYFDYHLFDYLHYLLPLLLSKFNVTLVTCDKQIMEKYSSISGLQISYHPFARYLMRLMNNKILRPLGWIMGWLWTYSITRSVDYVVVPRDTRPFQHMVTSWKKSLVVRPALGYDDKLYLQHIYSKEIGFPDIMKFTRRQASIFDGLLGSNFLTTARGPKDLKFYTVTGHDIKTFFIKLGIEEDKIFVVGNPNYEGLPNLSDYSLDLDLPKYSKLYVFFSSQVEVTATECDKMLNYLRVIFDNDPDILFLWKLHPTMEKDRVKKLSEWLLCKGFSRVYVIQAFKGDEENARIIAMSNGVFVEESNVGLLACMQEKPLFVIDLGVAQKENFFCLFDGIMDCRNPDNFKRCLDKSNYKDVINAQNLMLEKICLPNDSPCTKIVDIIEQSIL